jgi:hypothetical protein
MGHASRAPVVPAVVHFRVGADIDRAHPEVAHWSTPAEAFLGSIGAEWVQPRTCTIAAVLGPGRDQTIRADVLEKGHK